MRKTILIVCLAWLVSLAAAQTKVAGVIECGKPEKAMSIEVGDRPGHTYNIAQQKCTWTKPLDFGVGQTKESVFTGFDDNNAGRTSGRGVSVETLTSGDKLHVNTTAKGTAKDNAVSSEGKWTIARGTGKAAGLKGGGTFKCSGTMESQKCEVEGEYSEAKK